MSEVTSNDFWSALPICAVAIVISIVFFLADHRNKISRRLTVSAHGALAAGAFIFATLVSELRELRLVWSAFHLALVLASLSSMVISFGWFSGSRKLLYLHSLTTIAIVLLTVFGSLTISDDWP